MTWVKVQRTGKQLEVFVDSGWDVSRKEKRKDSVNAGRGDPYMSDKQQLPLK